MFELILKMARLRRVRGPKLSTDKVSIVHEMGRKYKHAKILVTIRLDPTRLKSISRSPSNGTEMENSNETTNEKDSNAETLPPMSSGLSETATPKNNDAGEDISDSEISSMDNELMDFLTEHSVLVTPGRPLIPNQPETAPTTEKNQEKKPSGKPSSVLPKKQPNSSIPDNPSVDETYKILPRNVSPIVRNELHSIEDEFAPVDRMVFSLRDPLGGGRINLPVKSTSCIHFQCFDYENFCLFNKISTATKEITRRNLVQLNRAYLARIQQQVNQQPTVSSSFPFSSQNSQFPNPTSNPNVSNKLPVALPGNNGTHNYLVLPTFHSNFTLNNRINNNNIYNSNSGHSSQSGEITSLYNRLGEPYIKVINNPKPEHSSRFVTPCHKFPMYKCPICDTQFPLSELCISDGFNYFIRATPKEIDRVELLIGLDKYRLIDDNRKTPAPTGEKKEQSAEVIVLTSDEEDEDDRNPVVLQTPVKTKKRFNFYERAQELLHQETDNEIHYGDGESWDDPIVLD